MIRTLSGLISSLLLHSFSQNLRLQPPQIVSLSDYNIVDLTSRLLLKQISQLGGLAGVSAPERQRAGKRDACSPTVVLGSYRDCPRAGLPAASLRVTEESERLPFIHLTNIQGALLTRQARCQALEHRGT